MATDHSISPYSNATNLEWFLHLRDPKEIWEFHPTNLFQELDFYVGGLLTLIHALRTGGRYPYLWLTIFLHGIVVECFTYSVPDIDNFWHAQASVMFVGGRLPLHILFLYPTFIYTATVAATSLRLPQTIEPFAVGVLTVLMDIPYDIMGIRLLWWTWHDTDPNIFDRFYWVPWNSFYFHSTFAFSLTFFFNLFRRKFIGKDRFAPEAASVFKELPIAFLSSLLGMPGGIFLFMIFYHPLHDVLGVHSEVLVIILLFTLILIAWSFDRNPTLGSRPSRENKKTTKQRAGSGLIRLLVYFHYTLYVLLVIFSKPENTVFIGLTEKTGPCDEKTPVHTPIGKILYKRKYLCTSDYHEPFDWHCLPNGKPPPNGLDWYTLCGMPYPNKAEYVLIISAICVFAQFIYHQLLKKSACSVINYLTKESKTKKE